MIDIHDEKSPRSLLETHASSASFFLALGSCCVRLDAPGVTQGFQDTPNYQFRP